MTLFLFVVSRVPRIQRGSTFWSNLNPPFAFHSLCRPAAQNSNQWSVSPLSSPSAPPCPEAATNLSFRGQPEHSEHSAEEQNPTGYQHYVYVYIYIYVNLSFTTLVCEAGTILVWKAGMNHWTDRKLWSQTDRPQAAEVPMLVFGPS